MRLRRRSERARAEALPWSWPSTRIVPDVGFSIPSMHPRSVDFPEPLGPMIATDVPAGTRRDVRGSASTSPNVTIVFSPNTAKSVTRNLSYRSFGPLGYFHGPYASGR